MMTAPDQQPHPNVVELFHSVGGVWQEAAYGQGWYYVYQGTGDGVWASSPLGPHDTQEAAEHCVLLDWLNSHDAACDTEEIPKDSTPPDLIGLILAHGTECQTAPWDILPHFVVTRWQEHTAPDPPGSSGHLRYSVNNSDGCPLHRH